MGRAGRAGGWNTGNPPSISTAQSPTWIMRWWCGHNSTRFVRSVQPPWAQCTTWWATHHCGGASHPGKAHPPSRWASARRCARVASRCSRPTNSGSPAAPSTIGTTRASHASRNASSAAIAADEPPAPNPSNPAPAPEVRASSGTVTVSATGCPFSTPRSPTASNRRASSTRPSPLRSAVERSSRACPAPSGGTGAVSGDSALRRTAADSVSNQPRASNPDPCGRNANRLRVGFGSRGRGPSGSSSARARLPSLSTASGSRVRAWATRSASSTGRCSPRCGGSEARTRMITRTCSAVTAPSSKASASTGSSGSTWSPVIRNSGESFRAASTRARAVDDPTFCTVRSRSAVSRNPFASARPRVATSATRATRDADSRLIRSWTAATTTRRSSSSVCQSSSTHLILIDHVFDSR